MELPHSTWPIAPLSMSLLNFTSPFLGTPNPPTNYYHQPPVPYSYPTPQRPFLSEDYGQQPPLNLPPHHPHHQNQYQHRQQPGSGGIGGGGAYTKIGDEGTKTKVHAVIDYDYDDDSGVPEEDVGGPVPPVTPIQGPIYIKNGSVPVVPLYSHPVLNNGTFVQIPVSHSLIN